MNRSIFIGQCEGKQSVINEIDSLVELVYAEQVINDIAKSIRNRKLAKLVPQNIKDDFLKYHNL